jgi:hypothetical protein
LARKTGKFVVGHGGLENIIINLKLVLKSTIGDVGADLVLGMILLVEYLMKHLASVEF